MTHRTFKASTYFQLHSFQSSCVSQHYSSSKRVCWLTVVRSWWREVLRSAPAASCALSDAQTISRAALFPPEVNRQTQVCSFGLINSVRVWSRLFIYRLRFACRENSLRRDVGDGHFAKMNTGECFLNGCYFNSLGKTLRLCAVGC